MLKGLEGLRSLGLASWREEETEGSLIPVCSFPERGSEGQL